MTLEHEVKMVKRRLREQNTQLERVADSLDEMNDHLKTIARQLS